MPDKRPPIDEDARMKRSSLNGRVAFAISAYVFLVAMLLLLDRIGLPEALVVFLGLASGVLSLVVLGILLRSMRISSFYAAGRQIPATYGALALAGLAFGLTLPILLAPGGLGTIGLAMGGGLGLLIAGLAVGPFVRKTGALSLTELITARFPGLTLRLVTITALAAVGLMITAAAMESALDLLVPIMHVTRTQLLLIIAPVLILVTVPGGVGALVWCAAAATVIFTIAISLPLGIFGWQGVAMPLAIFGHGDLWARALTRMNDWGVAGTLFSSPSGVFATLGLALGIGTLAPLLMPALTVRTPATARRAGFLASVWAVVIVVCLAASAALATFAWDAKLLGQRAERLSPLIYMASERGFVEICGRAVSSPGTARAACAAIRNPDAVLTASEVKVNPVAVLIGLPALSTYLLAFSGLALCGVFVLMLMLGAQGVMTFATAIAHDGLYRLTQTQALASRRLAITRATMSVCVVSLAVVLHDTKIDPRIAIGSALVLSGLVMAPLLLLSLWRRARTRDAIVACAVSLGVMLAMLSLWGVTSADQVSALALLSATLGFFAGLGTSFLSPHETDGTGEAFVYGVLHGHKDVFAPDKGV